MKVTTKVVIRMSDGKVLSEESYEYHGPVAECKKGGGGGSTEYVQSPEARQIMEMMMPTIQRIAQAGAPGAPTPLWETAMPSGAMGYDVPSPYGIPDTTGMMPTAATMGAISPEVKAGVMAPYKEAEQQLMETLGAGNILGSARGGFSGAGATGLGRYWADAAPEYTKSLWDMVAPAQQAGWGAELQRSQQGWGAGLAQNIFGSQMAGQQWQAGLQEKQFPFTVIPAMMGESMPSPVVSQGGGKK